MISRPCALAILLVHLSSLPLGQSSNTILEDDNAAPSLPMAAASLIGDGDIMPPAPAKVQTTLNESSSPRHHSNLRTHENAPSSSSSTSAKVAPPFLSRMSFFSDYYYNMIQPKEGSALKENEKNTIDVMSTGEDRERRLSTDEWCKSPSESMIFI